MRILGNTIWGFYSVGGGSQVLCAEFVRYRISATELSARLQCSEMDKPCTMGAGCGLMIAECPSGCVERV